MRIDKADSDFTPDHRRLTKALDVTSRHTTRIQSQDRLIEAVPAPLMFSDQPWLEFTVTIAWNLNLDL